LRDPQARRQREMCQSVVLREARQMLVE